MAKVCLIRPADGIRVTKITVLEPTVPLGLAYIAASVRKAGHDVQVIDAVGEAPDLLTSYQTSHVLGLGNEGVLEMIRPDVQYIGVGCMFSHNWPYARDLVKMIRARFPKVPIIYGGEHISALPRLALQDSPADVCVIGEGEESIVDVLDALERGRPLREVPGIMFRDAGGEVIDTGRRQRMRNLDDIPWPAFDLIKISAYGENKIMAGLQRNGHTPFLPMLATRGCPYLCTFCTSPNMWGTAWVARDPKKVVDEIEHWIEVYGARNIRFQDLTAIIKKDWIIAFCKELIDRNVQITWQLPSGTRSEAIDAEVSQWLMRSGMYLMGYAPESGSERVRTAVKKRVKIENLLKSARAATDAGLTVQILIVMGFPEERVRDLWATLLLIARMAWTGARDIGLSQYMAYPGTEMFDRLQAEGIVDTSDRWLLSSLESHELVIKESRRVNRNYGRYTAAFFYLAGYATFFSVNAIRRPGMYLRMLLELARRSTHDVNHLHRVLRKVISPGRLRQAGGTKPVAPQP